MIWPQNAAECQYQGLSQVGEAPEKPPHQVTGKGWVPGSLFLASGSHQGGKSLLGLRILWFLTRLVWTSLRKELSQHR